LRAALAVWQYGGVTCAADHIGLAQPAVSRLLAALEDELGFKLFERNRKRLTVSERGHVFLMETEAALSSLTRLSELAVELGRNHSGLLRIAAIPSFAHGLMPRILAILRHDFPDLVIKVEECGRNQQIEGLLSNQFDIGLVSLPIGVRELQIETIATADAVCLLPAAHPLANFSALTPALLAGEQFVRLTEMRVLQKMVDDVFSPVEKTCPASIVVNNTSLMIDFVANELGVAITHSLSALVVPKNVVVRPFLPSLKFSYAVLRRKSDRPTPIIEAFITLARSVAANTLRELKEVLACSPKIPSDV
jgi:DNA-binding transcriptional LysR family regulator